MSADPLQHLIAPMALPTVSISGATLSIVEGNRGWQTLTFTVTLSAALLTDESVAWDIVGSGTYGADDNDIMSALTGSVTFLAGTTVQTISVTVAADSIWEPDENFSIVLSSPSTGVSLGTSSVEVTIQNDDPLVDDFANTVGNNPVLLINDDPTSGEINYYDDVDVFAVHVIAGKTYTFDLSAVGQFDPFLELRNAAGSLLSYDGGANVSSAQLTYTALADETLYLSAWSYSFVQIGSYEISVSSSDPQATVNLASDSQTVTEGDRGTTTWDFTVSLSAALATDETVTWTIAGSGANPTNAADFASALSGQVTFLAGETEATVSVTIASDSGWEPDEEFTITLSSPSSGIELGTSQQVITLANNDPIDDDVPNDTSSDVRLEINADPVAGYINYGNDADLFELNVVAGQTYTVSMNATGVLDTFLEIVDVDGTVLARNDNKDDTTTDSEITFVASWTGPVFVAAWSQSTIDSGGYTLQATTPASYATRHGTGFSDTIIGGFGDELIFGGAGNDSLFGNYGNDQIFGDAGNDKINGGNGDDIIYTGEGRDRISFVGNSGHDLVLDFEQGSDRVNLAKTSIRNFSDLIGEHLADTAQGAKISFGDNTIHLVGISADTLSADDFLF